MQVWERGILGERKCVFFPFHAIVDYRNFSRHTKISPPENDLAWSLKCFYGSSHEATSSGARDRLRLQSLTACCFPRHSLLHQTATHSCRKYEDLMSSCVAGRHTEISMQVGERNTAAGCWQFLLPNPMYLLLRVCLARKCGFLTCHQDFVDSGPWLFQARTIWQSIWSPARCLEFTAEIFGESVAAAEQVQDPAPDGPHDPSLWWEVSCGEEFWMYI